MLMRLCYRESVIQTAPFLFPQAMSRVSVADSKSVWLTWCRCLHGHKTDRVGLANAGRVKCSAVLPGVLELEMREDRRDAAKYTSGKPEKD